MTTLDELRQKVDDFRCHWAADARTLWIIFRLADGCRTTLRRR